MPRRMDSVPRQVQKQIEESKLGLGKVKQHHPKGYYLQTGDEPLFPVTEDILWKRSYFNSIQGRCSNYNPVISGFERGVEHGWCQLSMSGDTDDQGVMGARFNWLRTNGCTVGRFSTDLGATHTCSGFQWSKYFVPHYKTFRLTSQDIISDSVISEQGKLTYSTIPSGYTSMYTTEIMRKLGGSVRLNINTPNSIGVFLSGHLKHTSRALSNSKNYVDLQLPPEEFVRLSVTYYSPEDDGFLTLGEELGNQIDGWRLPPVPSGAKSHYSTFARKDPNSFTKFSYILATITPPDDASIKFVDIDWRAPNLFPSWRRVTLPVDQGAPNTKISGLIRVPGLESIQIRSRCVNEWGDFGLWHTASGILSAASNQKPGISPEFSIRGFNVTTGLSTFQFTFQASQEEDWRDFILVSGMKNDHYTQVTGTSLNATAGQKVITTLTAPTFITSGMLLTIGGGYEIATTGELHLVERVDVAAQQIYLKEPLTKNIASPATVHSYQVAKISPENKFDLFLGNDTNTYYFNICARNFNGGISPLAQDSSSWKSAAISITMSGAIFEDESSGAGRNHIRNGSFELPRYSLDTLSSFGVWGPVIGGIPDAEPYGSSFSQEPASLNYWYMISGYGAAVELSSPRTGRQSAVFGTVDSLKPELTVGIHAGIWQDLTDLNWNSSYYFKAKVNQGNLSFFPFKMSGVIGLYYELWEIDNTLRKGIDYQFSELPPGATLITSESVIKAIDTPGSIIEDEYYTQTISNRIQIANSSDVSSKVPFLRLCIYNAPEVYGMFTNGGLLGNSWGGIMPLSVDDVSFSKLDRHEHIFDEDIDGTRFVWEGIRLNQKSFTTEGDHLDINTKWGLNTVRRRSNTSSVNLRTPAILVGSTLSGYLNIPRLVLWQPNVPSTIGYTGVTDESRDNILGGNGSLLVVPSGKALMFEIEPRRTFHRATDVELVDSIRGRSIGFIMPSGMAQYGGGNIWYDPGYHTVYQVKEIIYRTDAGGSTEFVESREPIVARWGDIKVTKLYLDCHTAIGSHGANGLPIQDAIAYWHSASVKIWEIDAPFVASGYNTTGSNNVGYGGRRGLTNFETHYWEPGESTSIYR